MWASRGALVCRVWHACGGLSHVGAEQVVSPPAPTARVASFLSQACCTRRPSACCAACGLGSISTRCILPPLTGLLHTLPQRVAAFSACPAPVPLPATQGAVAPVAAATAAGGAVADNCGPDPLFVESGMGLMNFIGRLCVARGSRQHFTASSCLLSCPANSTCCSPPCRHH